jgi:hypothetical protein
MRQPPQQMEKGVTFTWMGGLGNQIWSLAAAYSVSRFSKCPLYVPQNPLENNKHLTAGLNYIKSIFRYFGKHIDEPQGTFHERLLKEGWTFPAEYQHGFHPWRPETYKAGTILNSYYQYYPAISNYEVDIRLLLLQGLAEQRVKLEQQKHYDFHGAAFLHIRRGDYLSIPHVHYTQPIEYYQKAIQIIKEEGRVKHIYVITDDPQWARIQPFITESDNFLSVADVPDELDAMAFMSLCCSGAIIANSTFSWWGAFLGAWGSRETVIAPQHWICNRVISLFPSEWTVLDNQQNIVSPQADSKTVCVTLSDAAYMDKAVRTIQELRGPGCWSGDIVLLCVDCPPPEGIAERYGVQTRRIPKIDTSRLVQALHNKPIKPMPDGRHFGKLTQWTKFRVFDSFFKRWDRVVYLDAGLRIFDTIQPLLDLPYKGSFLAPDDASPADNGNRFRVQLDIGANPRVGENMIATVGKEVLEERYFLNCLWVYDTALLDKITVEDLEDSMNKYPICLCNEMGIMNYWFTFILRCWKPFPWTLPTGKFLFSWSEDTKPGGTWRDFHMVKYSRTG